MRRKILRLHAVSRQGSDLLESCREVASAAARWAGKQEAYLADQGLRDAEESVAGGRHPNWATAARAVDLPKARAMPMPEGAEACKAEEETATMVARQGHTLMSARLMDGEACRFLVGCWTCGCYAVDRLEGLRKSCPGVPTSKGTKEQLRAMQRDRHPLRKKG